MFRIIKKSKKSRARLGVISTAHGKIATPAFIPVATQAAIKGLTVEQLQGVGSPALLCNTYHLHLRPGEKLIKKIGGLHRLMGWQKPIFTDSGGFQVFSLGLALEHGVGKLLSQKEIASPAAARGRVRNDKEKSVIASPEGAKQSSRNDNPLVAKKSLAKITESGVEFRSHLDGSRCFLTPEKSIQIQRDLGADIIFAFDECTSPLSSYQYTKEAMARTHRWAERCLKALKKNRGQYLFGIVQGGEYRDLREQSAKFIAALPFAGFAIGGSLGKSKRDMHRVLDWTVPLLPENKPRHLLGIGDLDGIKEAIRRGIDTFDCVAPTRLARNGVGLTFRGRINLTNVRYHSDKKPLIKNCSCYGCQNFSRAYLNHLFRAREMLGPILVTTHNLRFMENYMSVLRKQIKNGSL